MYFDPVDAVPLSPSKESTNADAEEETYDELLIRFKELSLAHEELEMDYQGNMADLKMKTRDLEASQAKLSGLEDEHGKLFAAHEELFVKHSDQTNKYEQLFASHQEAFVRMSGIDQMEDELHWLRKQVHELSSPDVEQLRMILKGEDHPQKRIQPTTIQVWFVI